MPYELVVLIFFFEKKRISSNDFTCIKVAHCQITNGTEVPLKIQSMPTSKLAASCRARPGFHMNVAPADSRELDRSHYRPLDPVRTGQENGNTVHIHWPASTLDRSL